MVSRITLAGQLDDATTGVVASRNRSKLHRLALAGASPAASLLPRPAICAIFSSATAWNESRLRRGLILGDRSRDATTGWFR
jgi:hypothetical protein